MIQDVGNIELCELLETELKTQCTMCLSCWNIGILYCTCGHFLHKEEPINNSSVIRWTFFHSLSTSSRKEEKMQEKNFQGINDRFIRDPEFCGRMIEYHRDEELCRRWDALADEDHTHHLTTQESSL